MVDVVAECGYQEGQLVYPGEAPGSFRGHEDQVDRMQDVCDVGEVVVGVISVVVDHLGDPDHEGALLDLEVAQDARIHEDVKHHHHLAQTAPSEQRFSLIWLSKLGLWLQLYSIWLQQSWTRGHARAWKLKPLMLPPHRLFPCMKVSSHHDGSSKERHSLTAGGDDYQVFAGGKMDVQVPLPQPLRLHLQRGSQGHRALLLQAVREAGLLAELLLRIPTGCMHD